MVPQMDVRALRQELDGPNPPMVIDVREPDELTISRLPDAAINIPLSLLPGRMGELHPEGNYVIVCRVGGRSAQATAFLLGQGFTSVRNVAGGMNEYAREIDPSLSIY